MRAIDFTMKETMRGPNYRNLSQKFAENNLEFWKTNGENVGDIDQFKIKFINDYYTAWDNDILVSFLWLKTNEKIPTVDNVWVNEKYRGNRIFSKLLWFLKTRIGYSHLALGEIHSKDMQEVVKGLSRFRKYWFNGTNKEPFDVTTLDQYYSAFEPTEWRLVLENTGKFNWPRFNNMDMIREDYDWQVD